MTATFTPPTESAPGHEPPAPPPVPAATGGKRPGAFEVFVAVLAAVALVAGMFAMGKAMDDDPAPADTQTGDDGGGGGADAPTDEGAASSGASAAAPSADHAHDDSAGEAAASDEAPVDDRGFSLLENGEQHDHSFTQGMDPATRQELGRQLALAREVALRYPTVADAEAAGFKRAGPFSPGLGAHYIAVTGAASLNVDGLMDDEDIRNPIAYIYDGVDPDSRIAGLFYTSMGEEYPEGFAGPNDTWHKHSYICIVPRAGGGIDTPIGADREITKADCDAVTGNLIEKTQWLLHVWPVPGYESPEGVFSHLSSAVTCKDGTYHTVEDLTNIGTRSSVCRDAA